MLAYGRTLLAAVAVTVNGPKVTRRPWRDLVVDVARFVARADQALYRAKNEGRNLVRQ